MVDGEDAPTVRVRGIYATALTEWLQVEGGFTVVDPSPAIADRFENEFPTADPSVSVDMTADRLGISITGDTRATERVATRVAAVGIDTFAWTDPTPEGAIVDGTVERTDGRGVIVDLDGTAGYLPDRAVDGELDVGESVRVQVQDPVPPWDDSHPHLDTTIRAPGGLVTLVRGVDATVADTPPGEAGHELARTTELLSVSIPGRWGVEWSRGAIDADMGTLEAALGRVVDMAHDIDAALDTGRKTKSEADPTAESTTETEAVLVRPLATTWLRLGRESRFALDDLRAAVTDTIPGHHRIKAGSKTAATAVDFVESLGHESIDFPFGAVTEAFGPNAGDAVRIVHSKPDGDEFALGRGTVTDRTVSKRRITVEREMASSGTYDAIGTTRESGDTATTRFAEGRWWYPTIYRGESGEPKGTYVNVATPVEIFPTEVRYVDLYVDVVKRPDGDVEIVDGDELEAATEAGHVPEAVADRATQVATKVAEALED